jgi:hypothetical protein
MFVRAEFSASDGTKLTLVLCSHALNEEISVEGKILSGYVRGPDTRGFPVIIFISFITLSGREGSILKHDTKETVTSK